MTKITPPPVYDIITDDPEEMKFSIRWIDFFNRIYTGDTGTNWTPTFTNLTTVGTPTITGRYYKLSQSLCFFSVRITPATSTSSTAGTTYINNFPMTITQDGIVFAVSGLLGTNSGMIESATKRIYVPGWSSVTVPLTLVGIAEVT